MSFSPERILSKGMSRRRLVAATAAGSALPLLGKASSVFAAPALQDSSVSGKVTMWAFPLAGGGNTTTDEDVYKELVSQFQAQYPDVEVDVQILPWKARFERLATAASSGTLPDVCYLNDDYIPTYGGEDGYLEPVDDLVDDDYLENALDNMSTNGTLYAVPILGSVTTAVANVKAFEQAGVSEYPTTWDELLALGPAFRDAGLFVTSYGGAIENSPNLSYYPLLWQAGGEVLTEDLSKAAFNSAEGLDALNFIVNLFNEGFVNEDEGVINPAPGSGVINEGKVGVVMCTDNGAAQIYAETWGEDAVKVLAPLSRVKQVSYGTGAGYGIFNTSKNIDATREWVKFITQPEAMQSIITLGGYIAPRPSLQDIYADTPILKDFPQYLSMMHSGVKSPVAPAILRAVQPAVQAAFLGQQSPEDALATAEEEVNRLIERG